MKTKILIVILALLLIAAAPLGWGVIGKVRIVSGGVDGSHAISGLRTGGKIWQWASGETGQYTFTVWCKGNGVFNLKQGTQTFTQTCNSATWTQLIFPQITVPNLELFYTEAILKAGDYADMFCLYPSDIGSCTHFNHVTNPSFEQ